MSQDKNVLVPGSRRSAVWWHAEKSFVRRAGRSKTSALVRNIALFRAFGLWHPDCTVSRLEPGKAMCESKTQIAEMILGYLADHPDAEDTLQGIVEWWILERYIEDRASLVEETLEELASEELIVQRKGNDGRLHYRMNRERSAEIRALRSPRE